MHTFFKDAFFNFEAIRILGTAPNGGADIAECLDAIGQIKRDDPVSWHRAWAAQAEKAEAVAEENARNGNRVAARNAFLRASNYTRASGYMFTGATPAQQDPRQLPVAEKAVELFQKATKLMDGDVHVLKIPFENHRLPGYLYLPPPSKRFPGKIPIVLNCSGADPIQEELFYLNPAAGPDLGYAVITFEGPGQGMMLRKYGLHMRHDFEVVTKCVVDHIYAYSEVHSELELDVDRLAVSGSALGGHYALRAAADPRIKACVAIDPLYDMWDFATAHISPTFIQAWTSGWLSDGFVNGLLGLGAKFAFQLKWEISIAGAFWGLDKPTEILLQMKKYTFRLHDGGSYLDRVKCPVLVSGAEKSFYLDIEDHTTKVFKSLGHLKEEEKELWMSKTPGEGGLQAKMGALGLSNQRTFHFLDRVFGIRRADVFEAQGKQSF
ncbi:MAG: hypothetical protein M1839_002862 [Geoglossum umbratile]|nr:MAG: hypothetical protein M1839_002862 [Geoglossum umbratile]